MGLITHQQEQTHGHLVTIQVYITCEGAEIQPIGSQHGEVEIILIGSFVSFIRQRLPDLS